MCNHGVVASRSELMIVGMLLIRGGFLGFKSMTLIRRDGRLDAALYFALLSLIGCRWNALQLLCYENDASPPGKMAENTVRQYSLMNTASGLVE